MQHPTTKNATYCRKFQSRTEAMAAGIEIPGCVILPQRVKAYVWRLAVLDASGSLIGFVA